MGDDLEQLNGCLSPFDVRIYKGDDGKHRIYGDINRIQASVDSP